MTRTIVIGLDGGNWDLISPWLESGELPNIKRIIEHGATAESHSYLPPVTVPNWKCYSTGKNPGKLGVYRFDHLDVREENYIFHHSTDFKSAELWDYLNDEGYRTAVVNMPTTYPPRKIDGAMICGGPDAREGEYRALNDVYTHPESLQQKLESEYDYAIHPKPLISSKDERGEEVDAILELIDLRFQVTKDLLERDEFDFLHVTSFYSNTLQHFFWQEDPVFETWKLFDDHIGDFLEYEDTNIILMSDHGCAHVHTVTYLNNWLEREGYLSLETSVDDVLTDVGITKERVLQVSKKFGVTDTLAEMVPERIQNLVPWDEGVRGKRTFEKINWEETDAIANAQGLIYITHERGSDSYERVKSELQEQFENLVTPKGETVAKEVHDGLSYYSGAYLEKAPDLVIEFNSGYHLSEATGKDEVFYDTGRWEAENIPPGIFAATGPGIAANEDLGEVKISDIMPTVLSLMDCKIPDDIDGEPISVADFDLEEREALPSPHDDSAADEDDEVRERLEDLGYLN